MPKRAFKICPFPVPHRTSTTESRHAAHLESKITAGSTFRKVRRCLAHRACAGQVSPCTADGLWSATDAHTHNQTSTPSLARSATESTRRTLRVKITGGCPFQVCRGLARGAAKSLPVTSGGLCQLCRVRRRLPQPRPRRHALPSLQVPRGRLCREAVSRARRARAVIRASNHHLCSPIFRPGRAIISTDAPAPATRLLGVESRGLEPRRLSLR